MNKSVEMTLIILTLGGYLLAQGLYLPGVSFLPIYLILLVILGSMELFVWFSRSRGKIRTKSIEGIPFIIILIFLNITVVFLINFIFDLKGLFLILFSMLFGLACYNSINGTRDVKWLLNRYVDFVLISVIVELGQFFGFSFCNVLWEFTHVGDKLNSAIEGGRYLGMASDGLQFAYHCTAAFAVILFTKAEGKYVIKKIIFSIALIAAVITNNTRSAQIAIAVLVCIWLFSPMSLIKNKMARVLIGTSIIICMYIYIPTSEMFLNSRFVDMSENVSSMSRIPMFLTAFNHAIYHPLGMGKYVVDYALVIGADSDTIWYVVKNGAHNILGNCVASFGFFGLWLLILLYCRLVKLYNKIKINTNNQRLYSPVIVAIFGLTINSFFHNCYILNGDFSAWFFIGIMLTGTKKLLDRAEVK